MGVNGLWKLLEASGKPVPVESLENKVLAVDVSIWLHQLTKGTHDLAGGAVANAHLIGLYHRICKLLFFKIKPIFVFDGGVPVLKKQTIAQRKNLKSKAATNAEKVRGDLLKNLLENQLLNDVLGKKEMAIPHISSRQPDMFELPPSQLSIEGAHNDTEEESQESYRYADLHSVDITSEQFNTLPPEMKHEILSELMAQRKLSSWHKMHEMPQELDDFSTYQMERLLKRRTIQKKLDETAGELTEHVMSLGEMESMFMQEGVIPKRVASNADARIVYQVKVGKKDQSTSSNSEQENEELDEEKNSTEDSIIELEEKHILAIIQAEEDYDSVEIDEQKQILESLKKNKPTLTKEVLKEQQTLLDDILKKKVESNIECKDLELLESETLNISEADIVEQNQILDSIKNISNISENYPSSSKVREVSLEITVPTETGNLEDDIFANVFQSSSNAPEATGKSKVDSKSIEIIIDPVTSKLDDDIFSDMFNETDKINDGDNIIMSDTSSESDMCEVDETGEEVPIDPKKSRTPNIIVTQNIDSPKVKPIIKNSQDVEKSTGNVKDETRSEKSNKSLELEIFGEDDSNDDNQDKVMSDNSETSAESLGKISEFITQTNTTANEMGKSNVKQPILVDLTKQTTSTSDIVKSGEEHIRNQVKCQEVLQPNETNNEKGVKTIELYTEASSSNKETKESPRISPVSSECVNKIKEILSSNSEDTQKEQNDTREPQASTSKTIANNESFFKNSLNDLQTKKLLEYQSMLEKDRDTMILERGKQNRLASSITDQMNKEAQELLQLFGIPFVVAPQEAEAQCAFLEFNKQTQGTITDDSDVWLFGALTVYKNFFDQTKHVLRYTSADIEYYFELSREKLIQLALLVGSDYTPGIQGVGPVTALEIIAKFSSGGPSSTHTFIIESLRRFKQWLLKKNKQDSTLSRKLRNVKFSEGFPSTTVVEGYMKPEIDTSVDNLSWGVPDLDGLRKFAASKFGWSQKRVDQTMLPIMKKVNQRTSQTTLDMFYKKKVVIPKKANPVSKRVRTAVDKLSSKKQRLDLVLSDSDSD